MAHYYDKNFRDTTEIIDGNSYERCTFTNCKVIYRGGPIPRFVGCALNKCSWSFEEAAKRTIGFLKGIHCGMGEGGKKLVEETIQEIRTPFPNKPLSL